MLTNFLSSPGLRRQFKIGFSYRYTQKYANGLNSRVKLDFPFFPLRFPDPSSLVFLPEHWVALLRKGIRFSSRVISTAPIFFYEIWVLRKLFRRLRPTILHINNGGYPAALSARAAAIAARLAGVPHVIMVVNNLAIGYHSLSRCLGYPTDRLVALCVSKFVTGSSAASRQLKQVLCLDDAKCVAIHNGIALRNTTETPEETRKRLGLEHFNGVIVGMVALMEPRKGHQVLLEAIIRLINSEPNDPPNIKVLLEGDGPLCDTLKKFVVENRLSEYCIFVGHEKNVMNFMTMLDVLVLPSIDREDFPNVILEAMGLGKPIIASQLSGIPEQVVDGETGLLFSPGDAGGLATAIMVLSDEGLRLQMGQAGLRRFQKYFTPDVAIGNYLSLYQSLMET